MEKKEDINVSSGGMTTERELPPPEDHGKRYEETDDRKEIPESRKRRDRSRSRSPGRGEGRDSYRSNREYRPSPPRGYPPPPPRDQQPRGRYHSPKRRRDDDERRGWEVSRDPYGRDQRPTRYDEEDHYYDRFDKRPRRLTPEDLYELPLMTIRQFAEALDLLLPPNELERRFDEYRQEYRHRQFLPFFREHERDEWFRERYHPNLLEPQYRARCDAARAAAQKFFSDLSAGRLHCDLTEHPDIASKPESARAPDSPAHEDPDAEATKDSDKAVEPADKESEKDTSRESEKPSGSGAKESDKTPTVRYERKDQRSKIDEEDPLTLFLKNVPVQVSRADLRQLFSSVDGCKLVRLHLSDPSRAKLFHRLAWATFETAEQAAKVRGALQGRKVKDFEIALQYNRKSSNSGKPRITYSIVSDDKRMVTDLEQARRIAAQLDRDIQPLSNPLVAPDSSAPTREALDRLITYLRRVHLFCYYCGQQFEDEEEMLHGCGSIHLRALPKEGVKELAAPAWLALLDARLLYVITNPKDPNAFLGKDLFNRMWDVNIVKVADDKYQCKFCNKMFMGPDFVRKHLGLKHPDKQAETETRAREEQFFLNYAADPQKYTAPPPVAVLGSGWAPPRPGYGWPVAEVYPVQPGYGLDMRHDDRWHDNRRSGRGRGGRDRGSGHRGGGGHYNREPLPPPPGREADPRAKSLRSYVDLDAPASGDGDYRTSL